MKIYSFYCKAQQRLKEIITQTGYSTESIFRLFCIFGDFYASGMQDAEVTKSLMTHDEYN